MRTIHSPLKMTQQDKGNEQPHKLIQPRTHVHTLENKNKKSAYLCFHTRSWKSNGSLQVYRKF